MPTTPTIIPSDLANSTLPNNNSHDNTPDNTGPLTQDPNDGPFITVSNKNDKTKPKLTVLTNKTKHTILNRNINSAVITLANIKARTLNTTTTNNPQTTTKTINTTITDPGILAYLTTGSYKVTKPDTPDNAENTTNKNNETKTPVIDNTPPHTNGTVTTHTDTKSLEKWIIPKKTELPSNMHVESANSKPSSASDD